jgi:hypothetical protein
MFQASAFFRSPSFVTSSVGSERFRGGCPCGWGNRGVSVCSFLHHGAPKGSGRINGPLAYGISIHHCNAGDGTDPYHSLDPAANDEVCSPANHDRTPSATDDISTASTSHNSASATDYGKAPRNEACGPIECRHFRCRSSAGAEGG